MDIERGRVSKIVTWLKIKTLSSLPFSACAYRQLETRQYAKSFTPLSNSLTYKIKKILCTQSTF